MPIWKAKVNLDELNQLSEGTIQKTLGIQFVAIGEDTLEATMPVDERTRQPAGMLHGGASVVLAESLGSVASILVVGLSDDKCSQTCVGIEVNASHLSGMKEGAVRGRAKPIRLGKSIHVWDIHIWDANDPKKRAICQCRLTVFVK